MLGHIACTGCVGAVYCHDVALYICLSVSQCHVTLVSLEKSAELIEITFGMLTHMGPVNHILDKEKKTHTHTTILLLFWNMSGTTQVSRYQKDKTRKVKTNLDLLEQEIVSGSDICWAICNAYSLRPPARSPPVGDTWVHLIPHSTHQQSSSLHGTVKAGNRSEIQREFYFLNRLPSN